MELKRFYAVRDRASGHFLNGRSLSTDGNIQLYSTPGPAKGLITKLKNKEYYQTGQAGFVADNLEVAVIRLVPESRL